MHSFGFQYGVISKEGTMSPWVFECRLLNWKTGSFWTILSVHQWFSQKHLRESTWAYLINVFQLINDLANDGFRSFHLEFMVAELGLSSVPHCLAGVPARAWQAWVTQMVCKTKEDAVWGSQKEAQSVVFPPLQESKADVPKISWRGRNWAVKLGCWENLHFLSYPSSLCHFQVLITIPLVPSCGTTATVHDTWCRCLMLWIICKCSVPVAFEAAKAGKTRSAQKNIYFSKDPH